MDTTKIETINHVYLLDHLFDLEFKPMDFSNQNSLGACSLAEQKVIIRDDIKSDLACSTLLHELIHLIADINSINPTEQQIDAIALGMYSFIKNNHELVDMIKVS